MQYSQQIQVAITRLDESLFKLRDLIKRGQQQNAIQFMEHGELKDRFDELQNIITISSTGNIGARGTSQTGTL